MGPIATFIAKRLAAMVAILLVLILVLFILQKISPTDPVLALLGHAPAKVIAAYRRKLGYDDPLIVQYFHYVWNAVHLDLGTSLRTRDSVRSDLLQAFPATAELIIVAFVIALVAGITLGVLTAGQWKGAGVFRLMLLSAASAPVFLLGLLGILLFYHQLHWLPAAGQTSYLNAPSGPTRLLLIDSLLHGDWSIFVDALGHLVLPAIALAVGPAVAIGRVLRSSLVYSLDQDYVRTARSKGLSEIVVMFRHAFPNSLNGALNMGGLQLGVMFAADILVEEVFAWPGVGQYTVLSIQSDDLPAIIGVALLLGSIYIVANIIVDLLQSLVDRRIAL